MSSVPFEQMMHMCSMGAGLRSAAAGVPVVAAGGSCVVGFTVGSFLDAALGLGQPGDARRELPRTLREELVEFLRLDAGELRDAAEPRGRALAGGVRAAEFDDGPVPRRQHGDAG